tara:strand:+ start:5524 stop:5895 length:372 start_codon:yes stop_codon:yes gene_type:complete
LATQKRKDYREDDRVCQRRLDTGLTRANHTTRPWGESEQQTGAEREEECSGHEKVGLGEHDTHGLGDETVHEEEHERVEEHSHLVGLAVSERNLGAVGGQKNTWAERQKKGGGDGNFLGSDIG